MNTQMKCPICNGPVYDYTDDPDCVDPGCSLMVTEHGDYTQETYESEIHIYECHLDHTFYMNPAEMEYRPDD